MKVGMPQPLTICVFGYDGEQTSTVTALLNKDAGPDIVGVCHQGIGERKLFLEGYKLGLIINTPMSMRWIKPKYIGLWIALDKYSYNVANDIVKKDGCDNTGYYRKLFPDPVILLDIERIRIFQYPAINLWINELEENIDPLRENINFAYFNSS
jgi:hypothetical protein